jgi:HSP20 family protein
MATRFVPLSQFDRLAAGLFAGGPRLPRLDRQIPVDAMQRDERLVLQFDLPGVSEENIELSLERRVLTVRADRVNAVREDDTVFLAERPWGGMSRQIVLGDTLDLERITASYANGVLSVSIPVSSTARSRKIEIGHAPVETSAAIDTSSTDAETESATA